MSEYFHGYFITRMVEELVLQELKSKGISLDSISKSTLGIADTEVAAIARPTRLIAFKRLYMNGRVSLQGTKHHSVEKVDMES